MDETTTTEAKPEDAGTKPEKSEPDHWAVARLGEERGKRAESDRRAQEAAARAEAAERELAALRAERKQAAASTDGTSADGRTKAEIDAEIERLAEERATAKAKEEAANAKLADFNRRSNAMFDKGKTTYGAAWDTVVKTLDTAIGGILAAEKDVGFLTKVMKTSDGPKVIKYLGDNPNEVAKLPTDPDDLLIALHEIAKKRVQKASSVAEPPEEVEGARANESTEPADTDDINDWMRKRNNQVDDMRKGGRRRRLTI